MDLRKIHTSIIKPSAEKCPQINSKLESGFFWAILMKIYVYFAISKLPGAKISLSNGNFDQIWRNCCNFLNMMHYEMDWQFHVRVLFWPLLGLFSSFKHNQFKYVVPNSCKKFLTIFGFQKTPKLSFDSAECQNFHFWTFQYMPT